MFHNGQYCGAWAVDTSGQQKMLFHVVTRGYCFAKSNGHTYRLEAGDAVFFPSDAKHSITNDNTQDLETNLATSVPMTEALDQDATGLVCGDFGHNHPVFERLLQQLPDVIVIRKRDDFASGKILTMMLEESQSSQQDSSILLSRLADCLFYLLVRDHIGSNAGVFAAFAHPRLNAAMELIHADAKSKHSLEDLARTCAMSRSAFSSTFKEVVGQTPADYAVQWRMSLAYRWLKDEGLSTSSVASRVGYESESSFAKAFTRVMGMGPGQARMHGREKSNA